MASKSREFRDDFNDLSESANMSDAELERLLAGYGDPTGVSSEVESLEPGAHVRGVVIDARQTHQGRLAAGYRHAVHAS